MCPLFTDAREKKNKKSKQTRTINIDIIIDIISEMFEVTQLINVQRHQHFS